LKVAGRGRSGNASNNIAYVPNLSTNLFSVAQGCDEQNEVFVFHGTGCDVYDEQDITCGDTVEIHGKKKRTIPRVGNLYIGPLEGGGRGGEDLEKGDETDETVNKKSYMEKGDETVVCNTHVTQPRPKGEVKKKQPVNKTESLEELHHRMGHISVTKLRAMIRSGTVTGEP
jgi:hypothetical protein